MIHLDKLVRFILNKKGIKDYLTSQEAADIKNEDICLLYAPANYGSTGKKMALDSDLQKCRGCYDPYNLEGVCQGFRSINFFHYRRMFKKMNGGAIND